ncbi:hypothetical protein KC19_5G057600 [Ceratodon purpureus]|uniref:Uncharacterized protein n=1 Tax=Ceratodon purpureus TaxID=3225 RepID=A0A8T0I0F3_CERPU|nr:hypothetical protein KC19_5G057600 [Ceratodon purpureus]
MLRYSNSLRMTWRRWKEVIQPIITTRLVFISFLKSQSVLNMKHSTVELSTSNKWTEVSLIQKVRLKLNATFMVI